MRISTSRTRNTTRAIAQLSVLLLCACSSKAHLPEQTGSDGEKEPRDGPGELDDADGGLDDLNDADARTPQRPNDAGRAPPDARADVTCLTPTVGPSPMRRLTHFEYDNSVRDLLGDMTAPGTRFTRDVQAGLFDNAVETQTVPVPLAEQYLEAAIALAQAADLGKVVGCDLTAATCMRDFITKFGRRAYRRPPAQAEVDALLATFGSASTAADPETGARAVIAAILASPKFLFRPEYGAGSSGLPDAKQVTPFELAGRLASLLWASVPDDGLLDLAASGQLATNEQVKAQARRMLMDQRSRRALTGFYEQWFGLRRLTTTTKDPALYPKFNATLRDAMLAETRAFVDHVLWNDGARLETMLTASYSFVNAPLAELYGVSVQLGSGLTKTPLDPSQRAGVLTQASVLTAFAGARESSPVLRGLWVRTRMLCQDLPESPAAIPALPPTMNGVSNRERLEALTAAPGCRNCHALIDGIGFGLEHYDAIGAHRKLDQGVPVDASGEIIGTADIDGPFNGGPALARLLGQSSEVRDCAATQWLRYALGRPERADDMCSLVALRKSFAAAGGNLQELMVALTQTDAFRSYRQPE